MALIFIIICLTPFSADKVEIIREQDRTVYHLIGNAKITDENTEITCAEAYYDWSTKNIRLIQDVVITEENGQIFADYAVYDINQKNGYMRGNVKLTSGHEIVSADSLYYNGTEDMVRMYENVTVEDTVNNLVANGSHGWYDLAEEFGYLVDNPQVEILRENKGPIQINAYEFKIQTRENLFYGLDSVTAFIDSIILYCDTFAYDLQADTGTMIEPYVIDRHNELKGNTGRLEMDNKEIKEFSVTQGWSRYHTEEGSKNVVEGGLIKILFRDGQAKEIIVEGQPKGVLYMKKEHTDAGDQGTN